MRAGRASALLMFGVALAACQATPSPQSPVTGSGGPRTPPPLAADADRRLAAEVARFLDAWAVKRQPHAAVDGRASEAFGDRRFVPAAALSPAEYKAQAEAASAAASTPMSKQAFETALETQLGAALDDDPSGPQSAAPAVAPSTSLEATLVPFSPDVVREKQSDLWEHLAERRPRALLVAGVPSLAYQVRDWNDIKWTASGTVGFRFAMANIIRQRDVDVQAVVTAIKLSTEETTVVTLWSDEGRQGAEWRLLGVELPARR